MLLFNVKRRIFRMLSLYTIGMGYFVDVVWVGLSIKKPLGVSLIQRGHRNIPDTTHPFMPCGRGFRAHHHRKIRNCLRLLKIAYAPRQFCAHHIETPYTDGFRY